MFSQIKFPLMIKRKYSLLFLNIIRPKHIWIDNDILSALTSYFSRPLEPILKEYIEENPNLLLLIIIMLELVMSYCL